MVIVEVYIYKTKTPATKAGNEKIFTVKVGSRKPARLNPPPENMPGEQDEEANRTAALARELRELRNRMQAIEAAASSASPPPAGSNEQTRYGLSSVEKFDAYTKQARVVSLMLSGVSKTHPVNATALDDR